MIKDMNVMKGKFTLALVLLLCAFGMAQAQPGWNWPQDEAQRDIAKTQNVLYSDYSKAGNFEAAKGPLSWLLKNTPDLNASIYINGAKIYEGLEATEKDAKQKTVYQDSAMVMYDLRAKHFDGKPNVLNRKAIKAYKYYKGRKEKYAETLELFKEVYKLNEATKIADVNTIGYFDILRRSKLSGHAISDDDVLKIYGDVTDVLDKKEQSPRIKDYKNKIDGMLVGMVKMDCEFIANKLGPQFEANPNDLNMAKKIVGLALTYKCFDLPIALKASKSVHAQEPNFGMAKFIGIKYASSGNYSEALKYYKEAISLTEENTKKGDIYMDMASMAAKKGSKGEARNLAKQAVAMDPSLAYKAYTFIGSLYSASYNQCKKGVSRVKDRGVFLAAYKMYQKAGNNSAMAKMKEQFPSAENIFTENMEVGQSMTVGCWINETVTLQKR